MNWDKHRYKIIGAIVVLIVLLVMCIHNFGPRNTAKYVFMPMTLFGVAFAYIYDHKKNKDKK